MNRPPAVALSAEDVDFFRSVLRAQAERLAQDLEEAQREVAGLIRDSGEGSGDDEVDAGSKAFEREQEMAVVAQVEDALAEVQQALGRIDQGTYGTCDVCGKPIGKPRLEVYPRATICVTCKEAAGG